MKDPSRLSLHAATTLGSIGQYCGQIAQAHGGVIGMTGSGFIDPGGTGNGGTLAGYAMCNGKSYGSPDKGFGAGIHGMAIFRRERSRIDFSDDLAVTQHHHAVDVCFRQCHQ